MSSIFSTVIGKLKTFAQVTEEFAAHLLLAAEHDPTVRANAPAILSSFKQAAGNAVDLADTYIGGMIEPALKGLGVSFEVLLADITKGASTAANPYINDNIDRAAKALHAEIDAMAVMAKGRIGALTLPAELTNTTGAPVITPVPDHLVAAA